MFDIRQIIFVKVIKELHGITRFRVKRHSKILRTTKFGRVNFPRIRKMFDTLMIYLRINHDWEKHDQNKPRPWKTGIFSFKRFYSAVTLAYTCTAFLRRFEFSHYLEKSTYFPSSFDQKSFLDFISHSLIFRLTVWCLKDI